MGLYEELKRMPLFRLLVPFCLGIILQDYSGLPFKLIVPACSIFFLSLLVVWKYNSICSGYNLHCIYGLILHGLILLISMCMTGYRMQSPSFIDHTGRDGVVVARVVESPSERERGFRVLIEPLSLFRGDSLIQTSGRAIGWFEKHGSAALLRAGDIIVLPDRFLEIRNAGNPFEFDYKRYTRVQGILAEIYLSDDQWFVYERGKGMRLQRMAGRIREHLLNIIADNGISGNEYAVAAALLLGNRSGLDDDLRQSYAASGAMHILAVSGLHVGILYLFLYWIFGFLRNIRFYDMFSFVTTVLVIWFYALLTGLSPSVTRSATMFSFLAFSRFTGRPSSVFNTLSASALVQLIADPLILFVAGFQLSYAAVAGITIFRPMISSLMKIRNRIIEKVWTLTTISLSAQLFIFPLIIHYFNQFPNYFVLTNLFAVPLAMIILYSGIVMFIFSFIPFLAASFASVLNISLAFLNYITHTISYLPFSHTTGIFISFPVLIILYPTIISGLLFIQSRKRVFMHMALIFAIAASVFSAEHKIKTSGQQIFIVYNSGRNALYNFISGRDNILISDSYFFNDSSPLPSAAKKPSLYFKATQITCKTAADFFYPAPVGTNYPYTVYGNFAYFNGYSIFFARCNEPLYWRAPDCFPVDLLVISSGYSGNLGKLHEYIVPEFVVIDSSVGFYRRYELIGQCRAAGLRYHDVGNSGAFVINF